MFQFATSSLQIVKTIRLIVTSSLYNEAQNKLKGALDRVRIDLRLRDGWMNGRGGK